MVLAALQAGALAAQKTDVLVLRNGDRITGEIKKLERGTLSFSTDDVGTLNVEWDKIVRLTSLHYHELDTELGERFFGTLDSVDVEAALLVGTDTLKIVNIVRMFPINPSFFKRLDGYIDLGLSLQKANNLVQFTTDMSATYRTRDWYAGAQFTMFLQDQDESESLSRLTATTGARRFVDARWYALGTGSLEQNEELGLDLRGLVGTGFGYALKQTIKAEHTAAAGFTFITERFTGESEFTQAVEGLLSGSMSWFRADRPKTDIRLSLELYPGITAWGRLRGTFNARVSYEVLKDFTIGVTLFDTFDSRPPSADLATNDFGFSLTTGWTF